MTRRSPNLRTRLPRRKLRLQLFLAGLRPSSYSDRTWHLTTYPQFLGGTMKTKFSLSLMIAAALLALAAFSYGQAGTDVKKAADDTGKATATAAKKTAHVTKKAAVKTGEATETAAKDTGKATKTVAKDTGKGTEKVADKTGKVTETAAKDTGHGVKKGAKAVGHGVKKGAE